MLFAAAELAADEQWRGFRGLESQARSDAPIRALDWTAQGARQWMTPIPGDGVSSPVPTADRIYFTTSWQSAASDRMRRMLAVALLLFAGGAAIAAGMTWNNQAVRASIAVGALAVVGLCALLWWPGTGDLVRTPQRAVVVGATQMTALGIAAYSLISPVGRQRLPFVLALVIPVAWSVSELELQPGLTIGVATAFVLLQVSLVVAVVYALRLPAVADVRRHRISGWLALLLMPIPFVAAGAATTEQIVTRAVVALDRQSGKRLWITEVATEPRGNYHVYNSPATPTPVVVADTLYAYFGSTGLVALGLDGRVRWMNTGLSFDSLFGVGTSPVEHDGVVLLSSGGTDRPYLAAIDAKSGTELWRQVRPKSRNIDGNNRTPPILFWQGEPCILWWELEVLTCFSVRSGKQLMQYRLSVPLRVGAFTASAVLYDGDVYLGEENGAVRLDLDALQQGRDPVVWFSRGPGTDCASPVVANGLLFMVSESGIASARDVETGEVVWDELLDGSEYFASPVTDDRSVLFCSRDGQCTFVRASRQFEVLARNSVPPGLMATPAIQDGILYLRLPGQLLALF
ncbi:MAG TPA: PQQ-binding-like beta-propeller repeat protein [Vicinamibacterales bacterium]|nr:PQQ-binding-like beta-propeller repeat protein [Vicinamibacterales bacterium]